MSHDIKQLKPQKNSRYDQGYASNEFRTKVFESQKGVPIIIRSSLERKFIEYLESSDKVKRWGSECIQVPYTDPRDGSHHTYNPDFIVEMSSGVRLAVEIKPYQQTQKPKYPMRDDYQWNTYIKNRLKWDAATKYFNEHNIKFIIVTENFFKPHA